VGVGSNIFANVIEQSMSFNRYGLLCGHRARHIGLSKKFITT
jgi:hypothetical protein